MHLTLLQKKTFNNITEGHYSGPVVRVVASQQEGCCFDFRPFWVEFTWSPSALVGIHKNIHVRITDNSKLSLGVGETVTECLSLCVLVMDTWRHFQITSTSAPTPELHDPERKKQVKKNDKLLTLQKLYNAVHHFQIKHFVLKKRLKVLKIMDEIIQILKKALWQNVYIFLIYFLKKTHFIFK